MASYQDDDNERVHTQDRQHSIPTEHDRLLDDQGHDSLYRTLSVRFTSSGYFSDRHVAGVVENGTVYTCG